MLNLRGIVGTTAAAAIAQQVRLDTVADNIANSSTVGFKRLKVQLREQVAEPTASAPGEEGSAAGLAQGPLGSGVEVPDISRVHSQGPVERTDRPLDVAVLGEGFLVLQMPDGGQAYTRDGRLSVSAQAQLVGAGGLPLVPGVTVPADAVGLRITPSGAVLATRTIGAARPQEQIGVISLARFANSAGLRSLGGNLYQAGEASGEPVVGAPGSEGFGELASGSLELSNVDMAEEMTRLLEAARAYQLNLRLLRAADEIEGIANNLNQQG